MEKEYDLSKLQRELEADGLPFDTIFQEENGGVTFVRELTNEEQSAFDRIIANHDPTPPEPPISLAEKVEALLEAAEGKPAKLDAIKAKRR